MKQYELTYLSSAELSDEESKSLLEEINNFIIQENGLLGKTENIGRRMTAYPIKKKNEGFLTIVNFNSETAGVKDIEKKLKSDNRILRYLISTKKSESLKPDSSYLKKRRVSLLNEGIGLKKPSAKEKKVELVDLDKKIDENLKE